MKRIYKTFQGREIDMDQLLQKNETMPAVGNVKVNARGDELGPDGKIIRTREDILSEYYENNPGSVGYSDDEMALAKVKIQARKQKAETELPEPPVKIKTKESK